MRETGVSFHNKLTLQLVHISKILRSSANNYSGSYRLYTRKNNYSLLLTPLGECIYEQAPYMLENITKLVCIIGLQIKKLVYHRGITF